MIMSLKKKEFCTMRMMMGRKEQHTKRISFFFEDSSCALWIEVESLTMPEREREIHTQDTIPIQYSVFHRVANYPYLMSKKVPSQ